MFILRAVCLVFLILVVCSFWVDAQQQQKRKRVSQRIQHQNQFNKQENNRPKGNKANKKPDKIRNVKPEKPLINGKNEIIQEIPGLGLVKGRTIKSEWTGKTILQFFDIPYGKAPSGSLRFKAPVPATPWTYVLNAEKPHHGCPSLQDLISYETLKLKNIDVEDCLRLTINTKSVSL